MPVDASIIFILLLPWVMNFLPFIIIACSQNVKVFSHLCNV